MSNFFEKMQKARDFIEEYLKEFYFEDDNEETRNIIKERIIKYFDENDLTQWKIEFKRGYKSFSVILKTDIEMTFFVKESNNG